MAIVGATGLVGVELARLLRERRFPVREVREFASARSACAQLEAGCFAGIDLAFFDATDEVSRRWVPEAQAQGAVVIDNSAAYRLDPAVPLVVPEINGALLKSRPRLVSGPNCAAVPLALVLRPLLQCAPIHRVVASTYQSVSGAGRQALARLQQETQWYWGEEPSLTSAQIPLALNCLPHIGNFLPDGSTTEEQKIRLEVNKLLATELVLSVTAVRVPTPFCHAASLHVEFINRVELSALETALRAQAGLDFEESAEHYPVGFHRFTRFSDQNAAGAWGQDAVRVGRLRRDPVLATGVHLWVVADNLRKGAALNAVQIAEALGPLLILPE